MRVGWVSDEWFRAVPDATVELTPAPPPAPADAGGAGDEGTVPAGGAASGGASVPADVVHDDVIVLRSGPSGGLVGDVPAGEYEAVVGAPGHGPKRTRITVGAVPVQIRLLSDRPYGYCWPKWTPAGATTQLRVHDPVDHEITLWRHGAERELVAHVGHFGAHPPDALRQVVPDGDIAALGARWCANWSFPPVDPRLAVNAPDRSGLYWFHLKDQQGRHTSWPWVVSPARPTAATRIAVLASTLTWNAYNDWGGRSNYTAATRLPDRPSVFSHQEDVWFTDPFRQPWDTAAYDPLSFDRPEPANAVLEHEELTDPIVSRGAEHIAPAEWRLLGWLEREGFAHDVWADAQLATGEMPLDAYDVLIISTHPEYWTVGMVEAVTAWVTERGGKLAYLGGNGLNCPVELIDDGERMVVVNGDWREYADGTASRMEHVARSEAELLGVVTDMTGYETGAPYRVVVADHWIFAGTGLRDGDEFGHASLDRRAIGGASGHETDKRTPATPPGTTLLAKGTNPDGGGGEMVHIAFPGGGEVFSVGSISYTCSIAVDDLVSRVTANVLHRFCL